MIVRERKEVIEYIKTRNIQEQYFKAKKFIELNMFEVVKLKKRKPKSEQVYYFRINNKYRGIGHFLDNILIVTEISDHQ
ncbi:MAG: hypothetical protein QM539_03590 [Alphaproteobacteria bacterium]|nr:hypothetical protein [Alphaproteobacteria bacterium]